MKLRMHGVAKSVHFFNANRHVRFQYVYRRDIRLIIKNQLPYRELASFIIVILPFSRVHSVCISCALHLFFVHTELQNCGLNCCG